MGLAFVLEYLTASGVERLIEATGGNRHGHRDAAMVLSAFSKAHPRGLGDMVPSRFPRALAAAKAKAACPAQVISPRRSRLQDKAKHHERIILFQSIS